MTEQNKQAYESPVLKAHGTIMSLTQMWDSLSGSFTKMSQERVKEESTAAPEN